MSTAVKGRETPAERENPTGVPSGTSLIVDADAESLLASVRDAVRSLRAERIDEIFDDFDSAVRSRNIKFLADTIANWALGGQGYDRMSVRVNKTLERTTVNRNDPAMVESWNEFIALQESAGNE